MTKTLRYTIAALALLLATGAQAQQTATIDFTGDEAYGMTLLSGSTSEYNDDPYSFTEGDLNVTLTGRTRWWTGSPNHLRMYASSTMTIAAPTNMVITSIEITGSSLNNFSSDEGTLTTSGSWTGEENTVTITRGGTSGNSQIQTMVVTYANSDTPITTPPSISGETSFTGSTTVTITAGDDATIYWTTDGTDPTTETENSGTSPVTFTITESCTVKAIAVVDGVSSSVSSKTFTAIELEQHTIASLNELTSNVSNIQLTLTNAKVIYVDGTNIYVREGDYAVMFYRSSLSLPVNAILNGTVAGNYTNYYGIHEFTESDLTNANGLNITESSDEAQPIDVTIDEINNQQYKCQLVRLRGVNIVSEGSSYYASDGTSTVLFYNGIDVSEYADDGNAYDVVGLFNAIYNGTSEIQPVSVTETDPSGVTAPTISGETSFTGSTTVTITADEGATIYWTTDGTDPTTETENSGTSPVTFTITESCTVKAIAVVDGVSSSVSSKTFTAIELEQHTIASLNELTSNVSNIQLTLTNAKVVYVTTSYNGNVIHLREGGMAIMLYDTSLEMPLNAVVSGTMRGDFVYYYGIPEVQDNSYTNAEGLTINESDEAAEPTDVSIGDLLELNNRCDLVRISEVTITSEASGSYTNYYANYGDERIQLYGGIDMASYADDGKTYDVVAVFNNIYNGVAEIAPISVTEYVNTGISSVENADGENAEKVIYNLSGQRLSQPVKGINIINGKKVIVR